MTIDTRARPRAFTLLELLVSLGIIALLVSLVVVSLQGVRLTAQRTESINALRGIMRGYATYSADHRDKLLPGYLDEATLGALRIDPRFPDGTKVIEAEFCNGTVCDASSYVWRLSSYLDHAWESLFTDYRSDELLTNLDCEFNPDASSCGGGRVAGSASCPRTGSTRSTSAATRATAAGRSSP